MAPQGYMITVYCFITNILRISQARGMTLSNWVDSNGTDGKPAFRIGVPTCHDFPRFVFISDKSRPEVGSRWRRSSKISRFRKRPLTGKFSQIFSEMIHVDIDPRLVCKFREIWPTGSRWNRALLTRQKRKFRFCADRAQNLSEPAPDNLLGLSQISSKSVHFWCSYSRTRARRWNAHKVFPILSEATASSKSNNDNDSHCMDIG